LIQKTGGRVLAVTCDVSSLEDVQHAINQTITAFGRLDVAFNNAGVAQRSFNPAADIPIEEWDRVININLRSVFLCMKYQIPLMLKQGGGAIVNASSAGGLIGSKNHSAYGASKHGVIGLTKSAALDYATSNIRINAICPGFVDTEMIRLGTGGTKEAYEEVIAQEPMGRMGRPEEIAAAVLWLCSDAASFVTGHSLSVDGGMVVL
jgi:NAD(P)-dependent dehydrogenase (short-subunit alcohol dehydrogenase family)